MHVVLQWSDGGPWRVYPPGGSFGEGAMVCSVVSCSQPTAMVKPLVHVRYVRPILTPRSVDPGSTPGWTGALHTYAKGSHRLTCYTLRSVLAAPTAAVDPSEWLYDVFLLWLLYHLMSLLLYVCLLSLTCYM